MYVKEVMVQNQVGLHARPATFFIQKANEFKSSIWVEKEERRVNAKSLLGTFRLAGGIRHRPLDIDVGGIVQNDIVIVVNVGTVAGARTGIEGTVGVFAVTAVDVRIVGVARFATGEERQGRCG